MYFYIPCPDEFLPIIMAINEVAMLMAALSVTALTRMVVDQRFERAAVKARGSALETLKRSARCSFFDITLKRCKFRVFLLLWT